MQLQLTGGFDSAAAAAVSMLTCRWTAHDRAMGEVALYELGEAKGNVVEAGRQLKRRAPATEFNTVKTATQYVRDQRHHIQQHNTLEKQYASRPPPNPKKVPDAVVQQCADAFKLGFTTEVKLRYHTKKSALPRKKQQKMKTTIVTYRDYYKDIDTAVQQVPLLKETVEKYQVTPQHLLRRMKEVDPNLVIRTRELKRWLNPEEEKERRDACNNNLNNLQQHGQRWLESIVFIDEFGLWMVPKAGSSKVYCDRRDAHVHTVVPLLHLDPKKKIKIHILAAVNYHLGAFFMDFTTGTTDIQRIHYEPESAYKVSCCSSLHPFHSVTSVPPLPMHSLRYCA